MSTDRHAQQSLDLQASQVAARVTTSLQQQIDLATASRATIAQLPQLTNSGLSQWFSSVGAVQAPGTLGVTYIQHVSTGGALSFLYALITDPIKGATVSTPYSITPIGSSPPYCLTRLLVLQPSDVGAADALAPSGLNWCATSISTVLAASADSGSVFVSRILTSGERQRLGLQGAGITPSTNAAAGVATVNRLVSRAALVAVPVYNGPAPGTAQGRRAALVGWVGAIFDITRVVDQAANGSGNLGVTLVGGGDGGGSQFLISSGARARPGESSDRIGLPVAGHWTLTVEKAPDSGLAAGGVQGTIIGATIALIALMVVLALRRSVTARQRAIVLVDEHTQELHRVMLHDPLTGLPNHALVTDRAEQMLARNRRNRTATAALVVGLDHFSDVNGLYGWATGDQLLEAVAKRLAAAMREADTVGRLGGDEFVVLTEGASLAAGPEVVAERLLDILQGPFHLRERAPSEITISASVGIALGPRLSAESLLRDAGIAMRKAKEEGTGRYALFELDAPQAVESRLALEADLRRAVAGEEFVLRYQPIFDIETRTTTGLEALLRWERQDGRLLPPDHFLPHLERAGLMDTVGRWVVNEACRQAAYLHRGGRPISMAVNVSASQLQAESLPTVVAEALSAFGLDPHALVIDVAEMTLLENTILALDRLTALKEIGVRIAVDDFGTGFSSLAYLRRFPIDILKIDRSFIASMSTPADSSTVMHTLVQFGQSLGLEVIAEGIEDEGQIDPLLAANCDSGQGFLYGRPLTPVQLDLFLSMHDTAGPELWVAPPH